MPKRAAEDTPGFDFDVSGGSAAPGSSVNNCTRDTVADADVVEHAGQEVGETVNFGSLSRQEKKKLAQRLSSDVRHKQKKRPPEQEEGAELTVKENQIRELLALRGIDASARMIKSIVAGAYIGHSDLIMVMVKGRLIAKHRSDSEFQELATQKMARIINRDRILSRLQLMLYKKDN